MVLYILFESASGYGLFEAIANEEVGLQLPQVQESVTDFARFGKVVKAVAFAPFKSALHALENINCVSEGIVHDYLKSFLEMNLAKAGGKKSKTQLGVSDAKIGGAIGEALPIQCKTGDVVSELLRGIRLHFTKLTRELREGDLEKAQLGLGHSYSRAKVKFNVNRVDNMIIQAISLLDQLDKDINTFSMRIREWYSYHFPELVRIVNDNQLFARLAKFIGSRKTLSDESLAGIEEIVMDTAKAKQVLDAARSSMGMDIAEIDLINIEQFADRVISLSDYRKQLHEYLKTKMGVVAPNLSALVGEQVGARLISHAGSLTNLAKYPASTVQILGAEKALFRALKTKGNTPKYGLIFHSTFIGRAGARNKGRISRYLANKCSKASRIDCFTDTPTSKFGSKFRDQVEERLAFYETGAAPRKNEDVIKEAIKEVNAENPDAMDTSADGDKKSKKDKKEKKDKKDKKDKKESAEAQPMDTSLPSTSSGAADGEKKKKKKAK